MRRDFTYVEDIVNGISLLSDKIPEIAGDDPPFNVFNLGNNKPIELIDFITTIENITGKKALVNYQDMQKGDVKETYADISKLKDLVGYSPKTNIYEGMEAFIEWYKGYANF